MPSIAFMVMLGVTSGCQSGAGNGALIGGATGAGIGGLIGSYSHARAGEGALIGGAIGAATGAIVGDSIEQEQLAANSRARYDDSGYATTAYESPQPRYYTTYREVYVAPCPPPPPPPLGYVEIRTYHGYRGYHGRYYHCR